MSVGSGSGIGVVVVVPAFAVRGKRDEPVVTAVLARIVVAVAPKVSGGVHSPGDVPGVNRVINDSPEQPLQGELKGAGWRAGYRVADGCAYCEEDRGVNHVHPEVPEVSLESHVERIAEDVTRVFVIRLRGRRIAVLDE